MAETKVPDVVITEDELMGSSVFAYYLLERLGCNVAQNSPGSPGHRVSVVPDVTIRAIREKLHRYVTQGERLGVDFDDLGLSSQITPSEAKHAVDHIHILVRLWLDTEREERARLRQTYTFYTCQPLHNNNDLNYHVWARLDERDAAKTSLERLKKIFRVGLSLGRCSPAMRRLTKSSSVTWPGWVRLVLQLMGLAVVFVRVGDVCESLLEPWCEPKIQWILLYLPLCLLIQRFYKNRYEQAKAGGQSDSFDIVSILDQRACNSKPSECPHLKWARFFYAIGWLDEPEEYHAVKCGVIPNFHQCVRQGYFDKLNLHQSVSSF